MQSLRIIDFLYLGNPGFYVNKIIYIKDDLYALINQKIIYY